MPLNLRVGTVRKFNKFNFSKRQVYYGKKNSSKIMDFSVDVLFVDQPVGFNSKRAVVVALQQLIQFEQFIQFKQFVLVRRDRTQPESQLDRGRPGDSP